MGLVDKWATRLTDKLLISWKLLQNQGEAWSMQFPGT